MIKANRKKQHHYGVNKMSEVVGANFDNLVEEFNLITHNLANVSTAGYKRRCSSFSQVLESALSSQTDFVSGETEFSSSIDFSQGGLKQTGRPLDFALYGKGFFVLETPEGPVYTRSGTFQVNQNGQLSDTEGRLVAGASGTISIPSTIGVSEISVSGDGTISGGDGVSIGKFSLVDFGGNESKLDSIGSGCFRMPDEAVVPSSAEGLVVKQGYQESSNVQMIKELVDMIMVSRLYEANMKYISSQNKATDSLLSAANG